MSVRENRPSLDAVAVDSAHLCLWRLGGEPHGCERCFSRRGGRRRGGRDNGHDGDRRHCRDRKHDRDGKHDGDGRHDGDRWCRHDGPGWFGLRIRRRRRDRWRRRDRGSARRRALYAIMRDRPNLLQRNVRQSCQ